MSSEHADARDVVAHQAIDAEPDLDGYTAREAYEAGARKAASLAVEALVAAGYQIVSQGVTVETPAPLDIDGEDAS